MSEQIDGGAPSFGSGMAQSEQQACQCDACRAGVQHASDCAVHLAPAESLQPCDCGALAKAERRYVAWLSRLVCSQAERWKNSVRSWLWRVFR